MADLKRMESALRNAHKAGDVEAAKKIANALKAARAESAKPAADPMTLDAPTDPYKSRARQEADKLESLNLPQSTIASALASGGSFSFADEVSSAVNAPFRAIRDRVGLGEAYKREHALQNEQLRRMREKDGVLFTAGEIAGGLGTGSGLAKGGLSLVGRAAGKGLGARAAAGLGDGAIYGGLYGAGTSDANLQDRVAGATFGAATGAATGAALPLAGAGVRGAGNAVKRTVRGALAPKREAQSRVSEAMARDVRNGTQSIDDAVAAQNNQQIINVDRGGETTRALARAASNSNPEVREQMARVADDRFSSQSERAVNVIKRVAGTSVDDVGTLENLKKTARKLNKPAYEKAYSFNYGNSMPMELDGLLQRVPASAVRNAQRVARAEGRPFGEQLIASIDEAADTVAFSRAPSFRELDYIQRGLRSAKDSAFRQGAGEVGSSYNQLHKDLLNLMDNVNPHFRQARRGAAAAFGAEDALDAGRSFARQSRNVPQMLKAVEKLNDTEKKLFRTGFASEIIDKINSTNDRSNVIRSVFQSQEAREKMTAAFGANKASELEAFVRVETAMDALRGAMGNSTTTRQLVELGLIGGGGASYGYYTGDWATGAAIAAGGAARFGRQKIDQRVVDEIGKILASGDKRALGRVTGNATMSQKYMDALRRVTDEIYKVSGPAIGMGGAALASE